MNKNILVSLLVLFSICCLCLGALTLATGGFLFYRSQTASSPTPTAAATARPTRQPTSTAVIGQQPTATPRSTAAEGGPQTGQADEIPTDIAAQMDLIEDQVEQLRGLTQREPVTRTLLTPEQLNERLRRDFIEDYDEQTLEDDLRVLSIFGLIDPAFDLYQFYLELLSEQVAGFYDPETKEMVVIQGLDFDGVERLTYAHEFTHALQDQQYGLIDGLGIDDQRCQEDSEYCAAVQALVEGDASMVEQYWLYAYGSDEDRAQVFDFYQTLDSPIFDAAPEFIQEDFAFTYTAGGEFAWSLFEQDEFAAIDAAFADPPRSTEQIMHPQKYLSDRPLMVALPDFEDVLDADLRELDSGVVGEWYTYLILAKGRDTAFRLAEDDARDAAEGWGGDAYAVYLDEDSGETILAVKWLWDSAPDGEEFFSQFVSYARLRWGDDFSEGSDGRLIWEDTSDGTVVIQQTGAAVHWVIAAERATADRLVDAISAAQPEGTS